MFWQEPRLLTDFFLGQVENPVSRSDHEWVQEGEKVLETCIGGNKPMINMLRVHHCRRGSWCTCEISVLEDPRRPKTAGAL